MWRSSSSASRPVRLGVQPRHLQRAGVQHHQAHPVRDHVVHLPGDAGPLLGLGPFGLEVLLRL
jgi:hypothetical protein